MSPVPQQYPESHTLKITWRDISLPLHSLLSSLQPRASETKTGFSQAPWHWRFKRQRWGPDLIWVMTFTFRIPKCRRWSISPDIDGIWGVLQPSYNLLWTCTSCSCMLVLFQGERRQHIWPMETVSYTHVYMLLPCIVWLMVPSDLIWQWYKLFQ